MKKFAKVVSIALVAVLALGLLCACGVSQNAADKINEKAEKKEYYTKEELVKKYGEPTIDATVAGIGACTWVNGCKTLEEVEEKLDAGKKLEALVVTFAGGKAMSATYGEYNGK